MPHRLHHLVSLYDRRKIGRRELLHGLATLMVSSQVAGQTRDAAGAESVVRARTLNHVTIYTADVARSKAFYQRLTGLPIRDEGKDFCELRLEGAFLGLYAADAGQRSGIDHFCLGIERYEATQLLRDLKQSVPDAHPTLEDGQVYVRDPDGVRFQFADVSYKR